MAKFECKVCGYIYNEQQAGRPFEELTECPICNEDKSNFKMLEEEEVFFEWADEDDETIIDVEVRPVEAEDEPAVTSEEEKDEVATEFAEVEKIQEPIAEKTESEPVEKAEENVQSADANAGQEVGVTEDAVLNDASALKRDMSNNKDFNTEYIVERRQEYWSPFSLKNEKNDEKEAKEQPVRKAWSMENAYASVERVLDLNGNEVKPEKKENDVEITDNVVKEINSEVSALTSEAKETMDDEIVSTVLSTEEGFPDEDTEGTVEENVAEQSFKPLWQESGSVPRVEEPLEAKAENVFKVEVPLKEAEEEASAEVVAEEATEEEASAEEVAEEVTEEEASAEEVAEEVTEEEAPAEEVAEEATEEETPAEEVAEEVTEEEAPAEEVAEEATEEETPAEEVAEEVTEEEAPAEEVAEEVTEEETPAEEAAEEVTEEEAPAEEAAEEVTEEETPAEEVAEDETDENPLVEEATEEAVEEAEAVEEEVSEEATVEETPDSSDIEPSLYVAPPEAVEKLALDEQFFEDIVTELPKDELIITPDGMEPITIVQEEEEVIEEEPVEDIEEDEFSFGDLDDVEETNGETEEIFIENAEDPDKAWTFNNSMSNTWKGQEANAKRYEFIAKELGEAVVLTAPETEGTAEVVETDEIAPEVVEEVATQIEGESLACEEEIQPVIEEVVPETVAYTNGLEDILILPAQLSPMPLDEKAIITTKTVIGLASDRPLHLEQPVIKHNVNNVIEYAPNRGLTSEDFQAADVIEIIVGRGDGIEKTISSKEDLRQAVAFLRLESDGCPVGIKLAAGRIERDLEFCVFAKPDFVVLNNFNVVPLPYALHRACEYLNTVQSDLDIVIELKDIANAEEAAKIIAMGADVIVLKDTNKDLADVNEQLIRISKETGHYEVRDLNVKDLCTTNRDIAQYTDINHV